MPATDIQCHACFAEAVCSVPYVTFAPLLLLPSSAFHAACSAVVRGSNAGCLSETSTFRGRYRPRQQRDAGAIRLYEHQRDILPQQRTPCRSPGGYQAECSPRAATLARNAAQTAHAALSLVQRNVYTSSARRHEKDNIQIHRRHASPSARQPATPSLPSPAPTRQEVWCLRQYMNTHLPRSTVEKSQAYREIRPPLPAKKPRRCRQHPKARPGRSFAPARTARRARFMPAAATLMFTASIKNSEDTAAMRCERS